MTNTAHSAGNPDLKGEPRSVPAVAAPVATNAPKARAKRQRPKKPAARAAGSVERLRDASALITVAASPEPRAKSQIGTLLVGAGIGAAVTLSVMAFGSKRGRGSALAMAVTKSVSYAIARTTENGSLINLVARAVGSAI